jgi:hypothetical protein
VTVGVNVIDADIEPSDMLLVRQSRSIQAVRRQGIRNGSGGCQSQKILNLYGLWARMGAKAAPGNLDVPQKSNR